MADHQHLAVLGSPISHSKSPTIHRAAYEVLGLPWGYEAIECAESELEALLASSDESWRGFSLTMPLKDEAHRLAAVLDPVAEESGVVNTLLRLAGKAGWAGFNTDVEGLAAAIAEQGLDATRTIVLGSGATAVSAVLAARRLGAARVTVVARNRDAIEALVSRFSGSREAGGSRPLQVSGTALSGDAASVAADAAHEATLVISTLPGSAGRDLALPVPLTETPLFDVAYSPWPSPLAERWRERGGAAAYSGLGMLLHQALLQVRIFVAGDPRLPLDRETEVLAAMREAVSEEVR